MGRLIPAGTGFAHHAERRRTREQDLADQLKELEDVKTRPLKAEEEIATVEEQLAGSCKLQRLIAAGGAG